MTTKGWIKKQSIFCWVIWHTLSFEYSVKTFLFSAWRNFFGALRELMLNTIIKGRVCKKKNLYELKIPSLGITVRHHLASLVLPNSYPCDGIFNPNLILKNLKRVRVFMSELLALGCRNSPFCRYPFSISIRLLAWVDALSWSYARS